MFTALIRMKIINYNYLLVMATLLLKEEMCGLMVPPPHHTP